MTADERNRRREHMELALTLLGSYWREALICAVLAFGVIGWHKHNADQQAIGALREQMRVADSTLNLRVPLVKVYDTQIVHDTVKLNRIITRLDSVRDTVLAHITDTVRIREYVAATDSTIAACRVLAHDCDAFRVNATAVMTAQDTKIRALESLKMPRRWSINGTVGPSTLYDGHWRAGIGGTLGLGWRF